MSQQQNYPNLFTPNYYITEDSSGNLAIFTRNTNVKLFSLSSSILNAASDDAITLGSASLRYSGFVSSPTTGFKIFHAKGDANPTVQLGDGFLQFGGGGASTLDNILKRGGAGNIILQPLGGNSNFQLMMLTAGTATQAQIIIANSSDQVNHSTITLQCATSLDWIIADKAGTGLYQPLVLAAGGSEVFRLTTTPDLQILTTLRMWNGSSTLLSLSPTSGYATIYGGLTTAGFGLPPILAVTNQKAEIGADAAVLSFTPPAAAGTYRICLSGAISAANAATFGWTATWKDSNGTAQAPTNVALAKAGAAANVLTYSAAAGDDVYANLFVDIDNSATPIVVKTTFSGTSIAYKISAWIEKIQ